MATAISTVLTSARAFAGTDSNGINSTNGIAWANEGILDFRKQLANKGVDAGVIQETMASASATIGTYNYPSDYLALKAIELNYTDTTQQNYVPASKYDVSNLPGGQSWDWMRVNQPTNSPMFDDHGSWYEIVPTPQSTNNLIYLIKLFYWKVPAIIAATTDTLEWPENIDPNMLARFISAQYYFSKQKDAKGQAELALYQKKASDVIAFLERGSQMPTVSNGLQISGWEF
jgi:hypothetical protein